MDGTHLWPHDLRHEGILRQFTLAGPDAARARGRRSPGARIFQGARGYLPGERTAALLLLRSDRHLNLAQAEELCDPAAFRRRQGNVSCFSSSSFAHLPKHPFRRTRDNISMRTFLLLLATAPTLGFLPLLCGAQTTVAAFSPALATDTSNLSQYTTADALWSHIQELRKGPSTRPASSAEYHRVWPMSRKSLPERRTSWHVSRTTLAGGTRACSRLRWAPR